MVASAERASLPVLFLWHHHQPFYQPAGAERPLMPWVRLHAVRGYQDMITVARETGAAMTFNFSPALLEQIRFAAQHTPADEFERLSRIPSADLSETEKRFILSNFFAINWNVHVRPHARYAELLRRRGERLTEAALRTAVADCSNQDFTDLIALFNLAWIGFCGRREQTISELFAKRRGYTQSDVDAILDYHHVVLGCVLNEYAELLTAGQIEISTSPYSHAILPLLCDSRVAAPDIPWQQLPRPEYSRPDDAATQLRLAAESHRTFWAEAQSGLWPSEGSISEEALGLAAAAGFRWAVTDQGVLERSERTRTDTTAHFVSYAWQSGEHAMRLYFRDRALSDAIGFRYATLQFTDAVAELVGHLERIEEGTRGVAGRCVVVALDGENPWEAYSDGGEAFLRALFRTLGDHRRLRTATFRDHLHEAAGARVHRIHAGSWIDSNFRIWIGDPQKNRAWTELGRARRLMDELPAGDERRERCRAWLLRAQGSDWFWWYGEPFSSDFEGHFDELFRGYLKALHVAAGREPPPGLDTPIIRPVHEERRVQPIFPISPSLDGRETTFYEWIGACRVDPRQYGAAMGRSEHVLRALHYGFGEEHVFFRFDPASTLSPQESAVLTLHVLGQIEAVLRIRLGEVHSPEVSDGVTCASGAILEVSVRLDRIGLERGSECQFWVEITDDGRVLEKLPPSGAYHFVVPSPETIAANWIV